MIRASVAFCRRNFWRIGRFVSGLAAVVAVMAAVPAIASAQLTISNLILQRTSGPPGSVLIGGYNCSTANTSGCSGLGGGPNQAVPSFAAG